ncbi:MAG: DUF4160 domain-containing protein [Calditrichia bacterium]|jgi:hypothetical protein
MPEISRFYGIIIKMYFDDHNPPHFHAIYGELETIININTLGIIWGELTPRALGLVMEWASLHQNELLQVWEQAKNLKPLDKIDPLP